MVVGGRCRDRGAIDDARFAQKTFRRPPLRAVGSTIPSLATLILAMARELPTFVAGFPGP